MKKILKNLMLPPLVGMFCLPASSGAAEHMAELPTEKDFRVGDSWQFSMMIISGGNKVRLPDSEYAVVALKNGAVIFDDYGPDFEYRYLKTTASSRRRLPTVDELGSKGVWRDWPLVVGKKWRFLEIIYLPTLQAEVTVQDVAVTAYEEILVPAGKFWAFRIEHRGKYCLGCARLRGNVIPANVEFDRVASDTYWYSPEVKMDIRSVETRGTKETISELIGYRRPR